MGPSNLTSTAGCLKQLRIIRVVPIQSVFNQIEIKWNAEKLFRQKWFPRELLAGFPPTELLVL